MSSTSITCLYLSGELCLQLPAEEMMCFYFYILDSYGNMEVISNWASSCDCLSTLAGAGMGSKIWLSATFSEPGNEQIQGTV